jgi:hypothetical protein
LKRKISAAASLTFLRGNEINGMIRFLGILLVCISFKSFGQFTYVDDQTIPVEDVTNTPLAFPFAGGLNASQFNRLDLNGDDIMDLVIYDRMAEKLITFLTVGQHYQYAPEYENFFPPVENFVLLRDYNNDGKNDLFTGDPLGIRVFKNTTGHGETPDWEQYFFTTASGKKQPVILSQGSSLSNLQMQFDDLPSISDVDGDGDMDILSMRYPAGSTVDFHQNMSKEEYNSYDSLKFVRVTQTWGEFQECECGEFVLDNQDCPSGGRRDHTGGKSLLALDANGNGSMDLIISEAECRELYLLNNSGTSVNAIIDSYRLFPSDSSRFPIFPAAFYEDANFDGLNDLIVSPAVFSRPSADPNFSRSVSLYKNTGTNTAPSFEYVQNDFLQSDMIDVGDNSVPAFIDEDGDGDQDMFIASHDGRLFFFENTRTPDNPSFHLIDEKYVDFPLKGFHNVKIQFSDLDHNETEDVVFTATLTSAGTTGLYYFSNKSIERLDITGQTEKSVAFTVTFNDNILATDVNQDGYADLLVGRSDGTLQYWRNDQLPGTPSFTLADAQFVDVSATEFSQYITAAASDLNADGKVDLIIGDQTGVLKIISNYRDDSQRTAERTKTIVFNNLTGQYTERNLGGRIWPAIVSLHNTNKPSIVIGNVLGGIKILKNDEGSSLPEIPAVKIFPNPADQKEGLYIQADRPIRFFITNAIGEEVTGFNAIPGNEIYKVNLNGLAAGMYFFHFRATRGRVTKRVIIY